MNQRDALLEAEEPYDAVLIGAGIMSATLASLLAELEPNWRVLVCERLGEPGEESSDAWNNAGTGHSALCELNYMPEGPGGELSAAKAVEISEQFQLSRQYWAELVRRGHLGDPQEFIRTTPHMTLVFGAEAIDYLRRRQNLLAAEPLFSGMRFSDNPETIYDWAPLLVAGRKLGPQAEPLAATWDGDGTDVNFGALTRLLLEHAQQVGSTGVVCRCEVRGLRRQGKLWELKVRDLFEGENRRVQARFVFVGAGGYSLKMLQKARLPEVRGYGLFPISGRFLRCDRPEVVARHHAKVYGKARVGAPPMSVPHLDTRYVDGQQALVFGPYAGLIPKFLKRGSIWDLPRSLRPGNLLPSLQVAARNLGLLKYLLRELMQSRQGRFAALQEFYPEAKPADWHMTVAGQRAQIIKRDPKKGGVLQFGTELIFSEDRSISGLMGASPGASTAVSAMSRVLEQAFPDYYQQRWESKLIELMPFWGEKLNRDAKVSQRCLDDTAAALHLQRTPASESK